MSPWPTASGTEFGSDGAGAGIGTRTGTATASAAVASSHAAVDCFGVSSASTTTEQGESSPAAGRGRANGSVGRGRLSVRLDCGSRVIQQSEDGAEIVTGQQHDDPGRLQSD